MHEIFIAYSRQDATTANLLADTLSGSGLKVWLDRNAIQEGDAFDTQIEEAIAQTRVVIVIWSKDASKSHWVRAEAAYALSKHKLLPISIDESDPPLQFLQIQTIDFRYWDRSNKHHAFQQLVAAIAKRVDRVAHEGTAQIGSAAHGHSLPLAGGPERSFAGLLYQWLATAGLRFPEKVIELEYQDYFRDRTFVIAQFSIALAIATYVIYGVADMAMESGGVYSTRFRFMVAIPLMVVFFGLSFKPLAKRHSQLFICIFGITGTICTFINVMLIGTESPFRIETGNAAMNAMLLLGFLGLLPLGLLYTILLGMIVSLLHAALTMQTALPVSSTWLNYLHVSSMLTVACCIAYWREHFYRRSFAAELS